MPATIVRIQNRVSALALEQRRDLRCEQALSEYESANVVGRLWRCISYHWQRLATKGRLPFDEIIKRLESGEIGFLATETNLLYEIVLAHALESREATAAAAFDRDYMPIVRANARRVAGQRGEELVENFGAELIMPRKNRLPRIAGFHGRTPMALWLRAVVINYCLSEARKRQAVAMNPGLSLKVVPSTSISSDDENCEELLRPMFRAVIGDLSAEDRVLIKMLILDGVPQKQLALSLGVDSGTVTRRRQRVAGRIWDRVRCLSSECNKSARVHDCLNLILAGENLELRSRLCDALAAPFRASIERCDEETTA
jgi:DNA-directed RNA polymerase specialized sigma24 family protein